jgi:N-acetylglucosamine kinase-like BadF-type ATPase
LNYYLGVDGGGSKTYALLSDAKGNVLGKGSSGNGNHQTNKDEAISSIDQATSQALKQAGIRKEQVSHAYFGLAGADRDADLEILHPIIQDLGFQRYSIACDTMIGLRAGTIRPYGVSIICGTGTNCAGRNRQGEEFQCGGFEYMHGDFGGGGSLCVEVFRSVIRAWDGREQETVLTGMLLAELGYPDVKTMFNDFLDFNRQVPLHVVKLLFPAAEQGDAVATNILQHQGTELSKSVVAVIRKLRMEREQFDVVMSGSLLTRGDQGTIRNIIAHDLQSAAPHATLVKLSLEPVVGALWSAMEADGVQVDAPIYELMKSYNEYNNILVRTTA